ncbi:peroxiredoxin, partial [Candidatus Dependentiae bacterium]|nr:peroxiredoxin [Candidatus Dependentiae bacterium]
MLKFFFPLALGIITMNIPLQAITVGSQAPDFILIDDTCSPWQLSKHQGQVVVLYFYPANDTPGCTKQACSLRDNYSEFAKLNATVVGINYNSITSHKAFKEKHRLPFTLLSDNKKRVAHLYQ